MSLATMSSVDGGISVLGSATAASMIVPQFSPVQPPRRSHAARPATTKTRKTVTEGKERRCMALNISPGGERCNLWTGGWADGRMGRWLERLAPRFQDSRSDLLEAHGPSQGRHHSRFASG